MLSDFVWIVFFTSILFTQQTDVTWLPTPNQPLLLPCFTVHSLQHTSDTIEICEVTKEDSQVYQNMGDLQVENEYMNLAETRAKKVSLIYIFLLEENSTSSEAFEMN